MTDTLTSTASGQPYTPPDFDLDLDTSGMSTDSAEFLGVIMCDEFTPSNRGGHQWHLGVRPVDYALQGKTGMWQSWYEVTKNKRSKLGMALDAMAGVFPKTTKIGKGELLGKCAIWVRRDIEFGKDKDNKPIVAEGVLIPIRLADAAEQARADAAQQGGWPVPGKQNGVASSPASAGTGAAPSAVSLSDEDRDAVLDLIVGKTAAEAQMAAVQAELPGNVKAGLVAGTLFNQLAEEGHISVDAAGKIVRSIEAEDL